MSANILNEKQKKYYLMIHFENGEIIIMFVYILIIKRWGTLLNL